MSTQVGIGFSEATKATEAAQEAAIQAKAQIAEAQVDCVILFHTIHYNPQEIMQTVRQTFEQTKIIGCTAAGLISTDTIALRSVGLLAISSDVVKFGVGSVSEIDPQKMREAGTVLAREIVSDFGKHRRQAFLLLADGLLRNYADLIRGLQEIFGNILPIIGAGSCDDFHFQKSFQYCQDKIMTGGVTGLLLGGQMAFGVGCKHGWRPLGKPRIVNESQDHIVKTIDGKKAAHLYEEYFGDEAKNLGATTLGQMAILYPLGIYLQDSREYLLRNAVEILDDGSIVCQGPVPEGSEVHLMIGNKDSCKQAAADAAQEIRDSLLNKNPKAVIIFESLTRHKLLGRAAFEEIKVIKEILGHKTPLFGMYANGEISPILSVGNVRRTYLQNESIVMLAIP